MGERQNFYSLQLPEPGHILGPRDSGVTGLFIIRLAVCVVVLSLRLFFFLFRVEVLALEKQCRRRGEKNPPGSLRAPVAAEGLDKPRSFFSSSSFFSCSQSLFSSSVAEGGGWKPGSLFGSAVSPPSPPPLHLSSVRAGCRAEAGEGGKAERSEQTHPPRRAGKAPQQPSGSGSSKTCREISFPLRLPPLRAGAGHSALDLFFLSPSSYFFFPFPSLSLSLCLKKKKIWKNDTLVSSPATLQQRREGGREGKREKGGEGGEKERKRREERERRSLSALRIPCESVLCVHQIVWMCCGLQGSWSLLDWLFDAFGPIVWLHRRGFDRSSGRGTEPSYKKKVSETVTLQQSITSTPCRVNMST